jgi:hypothetical protein
MPNVNLTELDALREKIPEADRPLFDAARDELRRRQGAEERGRYAMRGFVPTTADLAARLTTMLDRVRAAKAWDEGKLAIIDRFKTQLASPILVGPPMRAKYQEIVAFCYGLVPATPEERTETWQNEVLAAILDVSSEVARRMRGGT